MSPSAPRLLWRELCLFDGLTTLAEPVNLLVADGKVAGLWPSSAFP